MLNKLTQKEAAEYLGISQYCLKNMDVPFEEFATGRRFYIKEMLDSYVRSISEKPITVTADAH